MAMRLHRFHLRSLMSATAVIAVLLAIGVRSSRLNAQASYHRDRAQHYSFLGFVTGHCGIGKDDVGELLGAEMKPEGGIVFLPVSPEAERILQERTQRTKARRNAFKELEVYHESLARECERAVMRPWLYVSTKPPPEPDQAPPVNHRSKTHQVITGGLHDA